MNEIQVLAWYWQILFLIVVLGISVGWLWMSAKVIVLFESLGVSGFAGYFCRSK